jgi:hypothetical protein
VEDGDEKNDCGCRGVSPFCRLGFGSDNAEVDGGLGQFQRTAELHEKQDHMVCERNNAQVDGDL